LEPTMVAASQRAVAAASPHPLRQVTIGQRANGVPSGAGRFQAGFTEERVRTAKAFPHGCGKVRISLLDGHVSAF
ncbi:MAG TPA: hypothetical protein VN759_00290, partial [Pseudolysinimonas sp.]|nr:hypothetical protein [Pseudolysinimonas sp.]